MYVTDIWTYVRTYVVWFIIDEFYTMESTTVFQGFYSDMFLWHQHDYVHTIVCKIHIPTNIYIYI